MVINYSHIITVYSHFQPVSLPQLLTIAQQQELAQDDGDFNAMHRHWTALSHSCVRLYGKEF